MRFPSFHSKQPIGRRAGFVQLAARLIMLAALCLSLNGCLGTLVGAAASTAVGVGVAVVKVPVKVAGKAAVATLGLVLPDGK
jgi:hypothetical protein